MFKCNICEQNESFNQLHGKYYCNKHYDESRSKLIQEGKGDYLHSYSPEIICPYCGYEYSDSWEMIDSGNETCEECGKEFKFERDVEVSYSTYKLDSDSNE